VQDPPCACDNAPTNDGGKCGGEPGANSCLKGGTCSNGICLPSDFSDPGAPCDDGIFCTDPDKCGPAGVLCFGEKIEDKEGPNYTFELKLDEIKSGLEKYGRALGVLESVVFSYSVEGKQKNICCEEKQQKDVAVKTAKFAFNAKLETPKLFIPSLSFDIKAIQIGVFVKLGVSAQAFLEGENNLCEDTGVCWKGGIQVSGGADVGIAAQDAAKIVSLSGSCGAGLEFNANVSCKEYQIGLSSAPVKCKINLELFDGFVSFGMERELVGPIPLINGAPRPLPSLQ
jgi:hypothetical protein